MKVILVIAILAIGVYGQTKLVDWPAVAAEQAYLADEKGRLIPTDSRALQIVGLSADGKTIIPGQTFSAGDDWLKTFSVKIRNVSDKAISSIRLHFSLPETRAGDKGSGFSLEYGKDLSTGIDYGAQSTIAPGQEVTLLRNDRHFLRDSEGIAKRTGMMYFNSLIIGASIVKFEDGAVWSSYRLPQTIVDRK